MSGAQSISTRRAYGVQRVCRVWHRARSSVYARRQATRSPALCRRRGPIGAAPDDVLVAHIRRVLEASPFHGEGYRKAWAKLRVAGMRTSKERVRRLMREHDLQAPPRAGHAHGPKAHDGTITTEAPDVMWGTDMTATVTVAEGAAFVFVAVDHCATACIGLHAAKRGNRFEALEPIRQGIRERFGGIGEGVARGLRLRHDHGSNYLADDFQQEVAFFGIESSPSFVREPEGNGVAERFIRTLKENLLWVRSFETIEELRLALLEFKRTYNEQWMLEKYDYRSPAQVRRGPPRAGRGGVEANTVKPLSKNPEAVHQGHRRDVAVRCEGDGHPDDGERNPLYVSDRWLHISKRYGPVLLHRVQGIAVSVEQLVEHVVARGDQAGGQERRDDGHGRVPTKRVGDEKDGEERSEEHEHILEPVIDACDSHVRQEGHGLTVRLVCTRADSEQASAERRSRCGRWAHSHTPRGPVRSGGGARPVGHHHPSGAGYVDPALDRTLAT